MIREQCIPLFPFFVNQGYNYQKKCVYIYNASFLPFSLLLRWWWSKCCQRGELTGKSCQQHSKSTARDSLGKKASLFRVVHTHTNPLNSSMCLLLAIPLSSSSALNLKPGHPYYKIFGGESKQRDRYASTLNSLNYRVQSHSATLETTLLLRDFRLGMD